MILNSTILPSPNYQSVSVIIWRLTTIQTVWINQNRLHLHQNFSLSLHIVVAQWKPSMCSKIYSAIKKLGEPFAFHYIPLFPVGGQYGTTVYNWMSMCSCLYTVCVCSLFCWLVTCWSLVTSLLSVTTHTHTHARPGPVGCRGVGLGSLGGQQRTRSVSECQLPAAVCDERTM